MTVLVRTCKLSWIVVVLFISELGQNWVLFMSELESLTLQSFKSKTILIVLVSLDYDSLLDFNSHVLARSFHVPSTNPLGGETRLQCFLFSALLRRTINILLLTCFLSCLSLSVPYLFAKLSNLTFLDSFAKRLP